MMSQDKYHNPLPVVPMRDSMNCICCNRVVETELLSTSNPLVIYPAYGGLLFRSSGNYGSTVFDPMAFLPGRKEEVLQVMICDECIKKNAKRVKLIHNIKRTTTSELGEFKP